MANNSERHDGKKIDRNLIYLSQTILNYFAKVTITFAKKKFFYLASLANYCEALLSC